MRVGIVGCGLIGKKRAQAAAKAGDQLAACFDADPLKAQALAAEFGGAVASDWEAIAADRHIDALVVATPNHLHADITIAALRAGKHVVCEKPLACSADESAAMVRAAHEHQRCLKTGFNHRHYPALQEAARRLAAGAIGEPLCIRARYGHGGRPGYDTEWRGDARLSGGGELLDQGVHLIDLCRWFLGDFVEGQAILTNFFWKKSALEDNAFVTLKTANGRVAQFHTSWTQWKNLFSLELIGSQGYLLIEGLAGSYGQQRLCVGRRNDQIWRPEEEWIEFPAGDASWADEWAEFQAAIREGRAPLGSGADGHAVTQIVEALYRSDREKRSVTIATS